MVIDFFIVTLSSLEDPVLDVSIKTLLLSSEFLGLILICLIQSHIPG